MGVNNAREIVLNKIEQIANSKTKTPLYSVLDIISLEASDFYELQSRIQKANGEFRFESLLKKNVFGELFFKIVNASNDLNEGNISKLDFINSISFEMGKVFENKLLLIEEKLYYKGDSWELIDTQVVLKDVENFIKNVFFIPGVSKVTDTDRSRIANSVANQISKSPAENDVIQFDNYYIENGELKQGIYTKSLPKRMIEGKIKLNESVKLPKELYELIDHLCGGNKRAMETLLDHIAMIFCNDYNMRQSQAKAIYLYGTTGENGKSTFLNFISELVGFDNTHSIVDLKDKSDRFQALNSMVALFPDAKDYWDSESCEFVKQGVTADKMSGRDLYKSSVSRRYNFSIFVATNHLIRVNDKTNALFRRLLIIACHEKLNKDNNWFNNLYSLKSILQARNYFVNRYAEIRSRENWELNSFTEAEYMLEMFRQNSDIVAYFVDSENITEEYLNYQPTRKIYKEFEEFCYEIGVSKKNMLEMNNFNSRLEAICSNISQKRAVGSTILKQLDEEEIYVGSAESISADDPRNFIRSWDEDRLNSTFRVWRKK